MKHTTEFNNFLRDQVNLDQTRLTTLDSRVRSVYVALKADSNIGSLVKAKIPQGSWAHQTIIKPRAGGEFDADFLLHLEHNEEWDGNPKAYPNAVYKALEDHPTYSGMPHGRKARCVYLQYAAGAGDVDCHLDIVPYVVLPDGRCVIVNRDINDWENTSATGFADWVKTRDTITNGRFRKVVRLMKYYKVERGSFDGVKSVILTTLLGEQVAHWRKATNPSYYGDLPTALLHIVTDLNSWLQANSTLTLPSIPNPSGDGTNFDHRWNLETYLNFRTRMKTCAEKMHDAYHDTDRGSSIKKWRELFGDSFAATSATTSATTSSSATASKLSASVAAGSSLHRRPGQGG